jgi:hypothetical protein
VRGGRWYCGWFALCGGLIIHEVTPVSANVRLVVRDIPAVGADVRLIPLDARAVSLDFRLVTGNIRLLVIPGALGRIVMPQVALIRTDILAVMPDVTMIGAHIRLVVRDVALVRGDVPPIGAHVGRRGVGWRPGHRRLVGHRGS